MVLCFGGIRKGIQRILTDAESPSEQVVSPGGLSTDQPLPLTRQAVCSQNVRDQPYAGDHFLFKQVKHSHSV